MQHLICSHSLTGFMVWGSAKDNDRCLKKTVPLFSQGLRRHLKRHLMKTSHEDISWNCQKWEETQHLEICWRYCWTNKIHLSGIKYRRIYWIKGIMYCQRNRWSYGEDYEGFKINQCTKPYWSWNNCSWKY